MSGLIRQSIGPRKAALLKSMATAQQLKATPIPNNASSQTTLVEEIEEQIVKLETSIKGLETSDSQWVTLVSNLAAPAAEEAQYAITATGDNGYLTALDEANEMIGLLQLKIKRIQSKSTTTNPNPSQASSSVPQSVSSVTTPKPSSVKLPKLELPTFEGDYYEWQHFWTIYKHSVHNADFPGVQKFSYLRSYLKGPALDTIDGIEMTDSNYDIAVATLIARFERSPEQIIGGLYSKLKRLPIAGNRIAEQQKTFDDCSKLLRQLENAGEDVNSNRSLVLDIFSKFPNFFVKEVCRRKLVGSSSTLQEVKKAIKEYIKESDVLYELIDDLQPFNTAKSPGAKEGGQARDSGRSSKQFYNNKSTARGDTAQHESSSLSECSTLTASDAIQKSEATPKNSCYFCQGSHFNSDCDRYITVDQRLKRLSEVRRCHRCLRPNHTAEDCRTVDKKINCFFCRAVGDHPSPLCSDKFKNMPAKATKPDTDPKSSTSHSAAITVTPGDACSLSVNEHSVLATAVAYVVNPETGHRQEARILFDNGSHRSYITNGLSSELGLVSHRRDTLMVSVFGANRSMTIETTQVRMQIVLRSGELKDVIAHTTPLITKCVISSSSLPEATRELIKSMSYAVADNFNSIPPGQPHILLGSDYFWEFVGGQGRLQSEDGIYLIPTSLGLILGGRYEDQHSSQGLHDTSLLCLTERTSVETSVTGLSLVASKTKLTTSYPDIDEFWALETIGIADKPVDDDDEQAMRQFNDSVYLKDARYQVTWPWKDGHLALPTNYQLALGRLRSLVKRFRSCDRDLHVEYNKLIADQMAKGIIEPVPPEECFNTINNVHYLPHHPVVKSDHMTTKVRIVYDASAKCGMHQSSLNQCLHRGPVILPDLCSILLRFRLNKVAIISDIEKAFLQLSLQPSQRDVTRFLWLKDPQNLDTDNNVTILRFARVPFGVISSPFLLGATIQHHLKQSDIPVADSISEDTYVDNVISGTDTESEAVSFYNDTKRLFGEASMNLREWCSNSDELMNAIPEDDRMQKRTVKVLGLQWDSVADLIGLQTKWSTHAECGTKREVLQAVASIYDPLGLFQPCTLVAKCFLREIWDSGPGWDEPISVELKSKWSAIHDDLLPIFSVRKPRCVIPYQFDTSSTLVVFSDASADAYATAVYLRVPLQNGGWISNLIFSKSRLAPRPKSSVEVSIPRLELLGLTIGVRAANFVRASLKQKGDGMKVYLFTDSTSVLGWLRSEKPLPRFVENRVKELRQINSAQFQYVKSEDNPADICTRGLAGCDICDNTFWWNGPSWLQLSEEQWPVKDNVDSISSQELADIEEKCSSQPVFHSLLAGEGLDEPRNESFPLGMNPDLVSSTRKLQRIITWCLRFIKAKLWNSLSDETRNKHPRINSLMTCLTDNATVTAIELHQAKMMWVKSIQANAYADVIEALKTKTRHQLISQLHLAIDKTGIIRCYGRLKHAELPVDAINPILLPTNGYLTKLVITEAHEDVFHSGISHTLSQLRRVFWIPKGRSAVRRVTTKCVVCLKLKGHPFALPNMPPWPRERVSRSKPFQFSGVDYLGPIKVSPPGSATSDQMATPQKMWVCLFTCMAVRAVHLEWVSDCTAQSFIDCLSRFTSRRGVPSEMISDNAPQFRLAKNIVDKTWSNVYDDPEVQSYVATKGIRWKFTTELAPWQGGIYERLIGVVKNTFKSAVGRKLLRWDEFATLITEIEAIVNSRPIVYVGNDFASGMSLRPKDFLTELETGVPEADPSMRPEGGEAEKLLVRHWKYRQSRLKAIWHQWRNEYLSSLRERGQSIHRNPRSAVSSTPHIGEVVLVKNDDAPRGAWKLARVLQTIKGQDGSIRSAELLLPNQYKVRRPINHLYRLKIPGTIAPAVSADADAGAPDDLDFDGFSETEADEAAERVAAFKTSSNFSAAVTEARNLIHEKLTEFPLRCVPATAQAASEL